MKCCDLHDVMCAAQPTERMACCGRCPEWVGRLFPMMRLSDLITEVDEARTATDEETP